MLRRQGSSRFHLLFLAVHRIAPTCVDSKKISGDDIGNNFFLDKDSIGKSRAQVATEFLLELNKDVNGDFVEEDPEELVGNNAAFFSGFTVVIATLLPEKALL